MMILNRGMSNLPRSEEVKIEVETQKLEVGSCLQMQREAQKKTVIVNVT